MDGQLMTILYELSKKQIVVASWIAVCQGEPNFVPKVCDLDKFVISATTAISRCESYLNKDIAPVISMGQMLDAYDSITDTSLAFDILEERCFPKIERYKNRRAEELAPQATQDPVLLDDGQPSPVTPVSLFVAEPEEHCQA